MESEVPIRLVLVEPPGGVDFAIQYGKGAEYECLHVQRRKQRDISFEFSVTVAENPKDGLPNFKGPFAQGPLGSRFIYVDVGTYAGQKNTQWSRRMKIPLQGITWALVKTALSKPGYRLSASVAGTGKDGGPNCATVQLIAGWEIINEDRDRSKR